MADRAWYEIVRDVLKQHNVSLVPYVPDNVLRPLIDLLHEDPFFTAFSVAREEEGLGIAAGAWMAGTRAILLMQTSGFATLANQLASLSVPFQIPTMMIVSERGTPFATAGFARMVQRAGKEAKLAIKLHPHMLRHACGYALANKGHDTRSLQAYLGHKNIQHTVRYTELAPTRFRDFWRK